MKFVKDGELSLRHYSVNKYLRPQYPLVILIDPEEVLPTSSEECSSKDNSTDEDDDDDKLDTKEAVDKMEIDAVKNENGEFDGDKSEQSKPAGNEEVKIARSEESLRKVENTDACDDEEKQISKLSTKWKSMKPKMRKENTKTKWTTKTNTNRTRRKRKSSDTRRRGRYQKQREQKKE